MYAKAFRGQGGYRPPPKFGSNAGDALVCMYDGGGGEANLDGGAFVLCYHRYFEYRPGKSLLVYGAFGTAPQVFAFQRSLAGQCIRRVVCKKCPFAVENQGRGCSRNCPPGRPCSKPRCGKCTPKVGFALAVTLALAVALALALAQGWTVDSGRGRGRLDRGLSKCLKTISATALNVGFS